MNLEIKDIFYVVELKINLITKTRFVYNDIDSVSKYIFEILKTNEAKNITLFSISISDDGTWNIFIEPWSTIASVVVKNKQQI